jgi:phosphinothricin acetyltransferase
MTLPQLAEAGLLDPEWATALAPVAPDIAALGDRLRAETAAGRRYLPAGDRVLRAFQRPLAEVRVLIVGQDPYPTPGHPIGLSFAVDRHVRPLPRSLANIYQELHTDLGIPPASHGDLSAWSDRGVMLLNRVLTVAPGAPASHRGWGWEKVTEHAIRTQPPPDAREHADHRVAASVAALGQPRVLRLAPVLARQRPARAPRRGTRRLAPARVTPTRRLSRVLEEEYEKSRRRLPRHLRRQPEPERPFSYEIRPARETDLPDIREIYNHYVTNSVVTFDEKKWTIAQWRDKFAYLSKLDLPFLVAESPSGQILGYALVSPWSGKSSYRYTVENSIYLGQAAAGKGLGRALLEALIEACEQRGIREMVAVISDKGAEASLALHEKLGFVEVGRMGRVGFKFGRWLGTIYLQKSLTPAKRKRGLFSR